MTPDLVNGLFEILGSIFQWANCWRVYKDKGYAGLWLPGTFFFTAWGAWNLYYYPALAQWWSFFGGVSIFLANILWVALMLAYGKKS